jgi:hypothetical protein
MDCKVRIGSSYEPKWFERRHTQGTYSGKNVPLDSDAMWLQGSLIGAPVQQHKSIRLPIVVVAVASVVILFILAYAGQ